MSQPSWQKDSPMSIEISKATTTVAANDGRIIAMTPATAELLEQLKEQAVAGGFASFKYTSGINAKNCIKPEKSLICGQTNVIYDNHKKKVQAAIAAIELADLSLKDDKLTSLSSDKQAELFNKAKHEMLNGTGRKAPIAYRASFANGIGVNLLTEKVGNETKIVLNGEGNPVAKSVQIAILQRSKTVIEAGEYKPVNSRALTIMKNTITSAIKKQTGTYKSLSVTPESCQVAKINGDIITGDMAE